MSVKVYNNQSTFTGLEILKLHNFKKKIIFKIFLKKKNYELMNQRFSIVLTQCATFTSLGKKIFIKILLDLIFHFY